MRSMSMNWFRARGGFTIIELLTVLAVGSILVGALVMLVGRSFNVSREHALQVRNTEDGRLQIDRLSDAIRNARSLDCDGDGVPDRHWLQIAEPYRLAFFSNIDDGEQAEEVTYWLEEDESVLHRRVQYASSSDRCDFPPEQAQEQALMHTLRNRAQDPPRPVFEYFTGGSAPQKLSEPIDVSRVARVRIALYVDVNEQRYPPRAEIITDVTPRDAVNCRGENCGTGQAGAVGGQCSVEEGDEISSLYNYEADFAAQAFADCRQYCGNAADGACCDYDVSFLLEERAEGGESFMDVYAYCTCQAGSIPPGLQTQNITGGVTNFYRSCYDGTFCDGLVGKPYCELRCDGSALCACDCS